MKVFVTGVGGQLGYDVMNELIKRGHQAIGSDIQDTSIFRDYRKLDITEKEAVERVILDVNPDAIIHCAAWTAVDNAEDEDKRDLVTKINVGGTQNIADVAKKLNIKMMYISTDYVFDGKGNKPWEPDCKDYAPQNHYGETKLGGELAVFDTLDKYFIVRIAWVFGQNGKNFIRTMLSLADKGYKELRVVDDQIGTPTYTYDLARLLVDMIETDKYGYYHATNEGGYISWADFAKEIFKQAKKEVVVHPVTTEEYGLSKAKRPYNSRLDKSKLIQNGFTPLPDWKDALRRYLELYKGE
ncbi:MAG: dTDP-4-dehydrorhamnose reductase [Clostridia bacterium]|nr:dTDP-4-dehydrorhamnose reductase [Clostridia bacterium]